MSLSGTASSLSKPASAAVSSSSVAMKNSLRAEASRTAFHTVFPAAFLSDTVPFRFMASSRKLAVPVSNRSRDFHTSAFICTRTRVLPLTFQPANPGSVSIALYSSSGNSFTTRNNSFVNPVSTAMPSACFAPSVFSRSTAARSRSVSSPASNAFSATSATLLSLSSARAASILRPSSVS